MTNLCIVTGCNNPVRVKKSGLCRAHYARASRHGGDPLAGNPPYGEVLGYFRENRYIQPLSGCKIWPYNLTPGGYGQVAIDGRTRGVHVLACEDANGPMPMPGMEATHSCRNRHCWAWDHLSWGTRASNAADRERDRTHPHGMQSSNAKLTDQQVREIRNRYAAGGVGKRPLAAEYGVSRTLITNIVAKKSWTHIT